MVCFLDYVIELAPNGDLAGAIKKVRRVARMALRRFSDHFVLRLAHLPFLLPYITQQKL
jgi:hypothetical protein